MPVKRVKGLLKTLIVRAERELSNFSLRSKNNKVFTFTLTLILLSISDLLAYPQRKHPSSGV